MKKLFWPPCWGYTLYSLQWRKGVSLPFSQQSKGAASRGKRFQPYSPFLYHCNNSKPLSNAEKQIRPILAFWPIGYCIVYTPKMAAKKFLCFYGIPMNIINLVNGDLVDSQFNFNVMIYNHLCTYANAQWQMLTNSPNHNNKT